MEFAGFKAASGSRSGSNTKVNAIFLLNKISPKARVQ